MRTRDVIVVACLLLVACNRQDGAPEPGSTDHGVSFQLGNGGQAQLAVWVAETDAERSRGLMGVAELQPDEGMAFVFEEPTEGTFWMKDTLLPLSIAFVDDDGTIVTIRDMEPCPAEPCPTYAADAPYVLAVEANAGYYARMGIVQGDRARLSRTVDG